MSEDKREDNIITKFEYNTILKYVNYYAKKYSDDKLNKFNSEYHKDIIFSSCLNKYLIHKNTLLSYDEKLCSKYISKLVKNTLIDYLKNKSNIFNNEIQNVSNPLNDETNNNSEYDEDNINNKVYYVNKENELDAVVFYNSIMVLYSQFTEKEKILFSYLEDNTDSYKWSISRICKELGFTRYEYDKCIKKIQELCKKFLIF